MLRIIKFNKENSTLNIFIINLKNRIKNLLLI